MSNDNNSSSVFFTKKDAIKDTISIENENFKKTIERLNFIVDFQNKARTMLLDNADLQIEMLTKMLSHFIPGLKYEDIDERFDYYFKETDLDDDEIAERTVQDLSKK